MDLDVGSTRCTCASYAVAMGVEGGKDNHSTGFVIPDVAAVPSAGCSFLGRERRTPKLLQSLTKLQIGKIRQIASRRVLLNRGAISSALIL